MEILWIMEPIYFTDKEITIIFFDKRLILEEMALNEARGLKYGKIKLWNFL